MITSVDSSASSSSFNPATVQKNATTIAPTLTPEMVQQMIISVLSAIGF